MGGCGGAVGGLAPRAPVGPPEGLAAPPHVRLRPGAQLAHIPLTACPPCDDVTHSTQSIQMQEGEATEMMLFSAVSRQAHQR